MIAFAVFAVHKQIGNSWSTLILVLLGYFVLAMLFGGLRGSRSQTIWALFWAAGIVHLWIRPLNKQVIAASLCFLVAFMYVYGLYKSMGHDVVHLYEDRAWSERDERSGRTLEGVLLGDLARSDVHAFLLIVLDVQSRLSVRLGAEPTSEALPYWSRRRPERSSHQSI